MTYRSKLHNLTLPMHFGEGEREARKKHVIVGNLTPSLLSGSLD
jgi:hypothetical protein